MNPGGLLRDPDQLLGLIHRLWTAYWWALLSAPPVLLLAVETSRLILRRLRARRLADGARMVRILPPPQADLSGAQVLWANLVGLLRPTWKRRTFGQPHVAFEYLWQGGNLQIGLWVPGAIPQHLIEKAVEAAWPAARTHLAAPGPPLPTSAGSCCTGGTLGLSRADHYPIRTAFEADPLRPLLGAASGLAHGQYAMVQILARPITGRRLGHARKAAAALRGGGSATASGQIFDLLTPGHAARTGTSTAAVRAAHPEIAAEVRDILAKAARPRFAVQIRYGVATTWHTDPATAKAWAAGKAHAIGSAFAVFSGANHFTRHRLHHPAAVLAARWLPRGYLLSVHELAAIAHLPTDDTVPGLTRAGARSVIAPPGVPAPGPTVKPLGMADAGPQRALGLPIAAARHHLQIVGATGVGKSTALAQMIPPTRLPAGRWW